MARDTLRCVLIHDQADIIDFLTLWRGARRQVELLAEVDASCLPNLPPHRPAEHSGAFEPLVGANSPRSEWLVGTLSASTGATRRPRLTL